MGKKKVKNYQIEKPKEEKKMVINMNKINLAKARTEISFKTGKFKCEKDKPRDKNWRKWEIN